MNLLHAFSAEGLVQWLADFYLLATLLLLVALPGAAMDWPAGPSADGRLAGGRRTGRAGRGLRLAELAENLVGRPGFAGSGRQFAGSRRRRCASRSRLIGLPWRARRRRGRRKPDTRANCAESADVPASLPTIVDVARPDCRRVLGRGCAGRPAALLGGRRGRLDLPPGRTCVGVAASGVVRDRPRPPEGPASAGESENHERRGAGPAAADDPLAGRPGRRRAAADPPRGPGPRMGPRAQPRPVAVGPGPMSAGGALRPSVVLVAAAGGAQRPGVSGRRRSGWRRSARLRRTSCSAGSAWAPPRRRPVPGRPWEFGRMPHSFRGELPCYWTRSFRFGPPARVVGSAKPPEALVAVGRGVVAGNIAARPIAGPTRGGRTGSGPKIGGGRRGQERHCVLGEGRPRFGRRRLHGSHSARPETAPGPITAGPWHTSARASTIGRSPIASSRFGSIRNPPRVSPTTRSARKGVTSKGPLLHAPRPSDRTQSLPRSITPEPWHTGKPTTSTKSLPTARRPSNSIQRWALRTCSVPSPTGNAANSTGPLPTTPRPSGSNPKTPLLTITAVVPTRGRARRQRPSPMRPRPSGSIQRGLNHTPPAPSPTRRWVMRRKPSPTIRRPFDSTPTTSRPIGVGE